MISNHYEAAKAAVAAKLLPATEVVSSDDGDADVAIGVEAKVEIDLDGVVLRETALAEQARRNFRKISDWQVSKTVVILSFDSFGPREPLRSLVLLLSRCAFVLIVLVTLRRS